MSVPADLKYTVEHEWLKVEGDRVRIGITDFAQAQLGDIVYVELPPKGRQVATGKALGVVESVKAASDFYSPISGTVVETNGLLVETPEKVNSDPFGDGWMVVLEPSDAAELGALLDAAAYENLLAEPEH
jgi:glycine cleavage system H protein